METTKGTKITKKMGDRLGNRKALALNRSDRFVSFVLFVAQISVDPVNGYLFCEAGKRPAAGPRGTTI